MKILHTLAFILLSICVVNAQTVWTGAVDTDWNNPGNWNAGVPTSGDLATISGGATNQPTYAGSTVLDFTIQNAGTLTFNSIIYNVGTIVNFGGATIINDDQIINAGAITFDNDGILNNNGTFDNYGVYDHAASAILNNAIGATFNNYGNFSSNGQINNDGLLNSNGSFTNSNGMLNNGTFSIAGNASFPFGSSLTNATGANLNIETSGTLDANGNLPNNGTITVNGMFSIQSASIVTNDGSIVNNNDLDLGGQLINNSTLTNNSNLNISSSGILENNGTVTNNGTITLEICGKLIQNAGNNIGGTIDNEGLVYEISGTVNETNGEFGETFTDINSTPAPIPACKGGVVFELDETGVVNFTADAIDQGNSYGSCGATLVTLSVNPSSFTTADIGVQIVTLTITDNFGVSSSCDDFVSVIPFQAPVIPMDDPDITFDCPANITVDTEPGAQFAEASWTTPSATTTCIGGTTLTVRARGDEGLENMELWVDCVLVDSWTVTTSFQDYIYTTTGAIAIGDVQVNFTNDYYDSGSGVDYNLVIDKVSINGTDYETEDASVLGYGVQSVGCDNQGYHSAQQLNCDGFFKYGGGTPECSSLGTIDGFVYLGEHGGSKYYSSNSNMNWSTAQATVTAKGGHMVTINDAAENLFLQNNANASTSWIGLNDIATEGNYVWENGETPGYTNWDSGEPNNYSNSDGAVLLQSSGLWRDREVTDAYEVIMEMPCCTGSTACDAIPNSITGFTLLGEHNNSKYFISNSADTWTNANASATANGGHLTAISDQAENDFIWNNITPASGSIWIGLKNIAGSSVFEWSNGEAVNYLNWQSGEPNETSGDVAARLKENTGEWTDRALSNQYEYVMEIPCSTGGGGGGGGGNGLTVTQISGPLSGSNFPSGVTEVAYEVTDNCGNLEVCIFEVTVNEIPAVFNMTGCPSDIILNAAPGASTAVASWTEPSGTSDCFRVGPIGVDQTFGLENGGDFPIGTSNIGYAVFDSCGNFASCLFNVVVNFVPATLTVTNCPGDIIETSDAGTGGMIINWTAPTGSTDCYLGATASVVQIAGPASGSFIPNGTTQVIYLITDDCLNTQVCVFNITIIDGALCGNNGGDADGDGVCADVDCDDNDASIPTTPGTTCDDGDPNTNNDVILPDGCTCAGTAPVTISVADVTVGEGIAQASIDICLSGISNQNVQVTYITTSGTALASADFVFGIGSPTIIAGNLCVTILVDIIDDGEEESNEEFTIDLSSPVNATILDGQGVVTIEDNDGANPCANNGGDADGDGVCADVDCDDNDASIPTTPGTTCDDGDPNTENDAILADGCTCEGTPIAPCVNNGGDADGDGVCGDVDCDDNDASIPTTPGTTCDDGDPNTENDAILADGCTCEGTPIAPCANNGGDADGDGVCADVDCDDNDASIPTTPGTTCDDGDPNTENDAILADGCTCEGTPIVPCANNGGDADGDGVCADVDCDDNDASIPTTPGTTCDDGDPNTENDAILADGCTCEGTTIAPCANNGGDADGDGVCADVDCDDNDASIPTTPGTTCDDGDPNTENDVILSDGCGCAGTPIDPGCNPTYTVIGTDVTVSGLNGAHNSISIYDTGNGWVTVFECLDNCGNPAVINLPEGSYYIHIKIFNSSWQVECSVTEHFDVTGGGCTPGSSCDDNDACTDNDVFDVDCNCAGTYSGDGDGDGVCFNEDCDDANVNIPAAPGTSCDDGDPNTVNDVIGSDGCTCAGVAPGPCDNNGGDADGDGVCADVDCDDNDANVPTTPGTSCDDGNPNTENDEIGADGCTCVGTPIGGCNPLYTISGNDITITGLNGVHNSISIFDTNAGWSTVFSCFDDCNDPEIINLPDSEYYLHVKIMNASYQIDCEIEEYFTISGGGGCTAGSACNDNDPCTDNDVYDIDCNCVGTYSGDVDGDGVCTNLDCNDNDPTLPMAPGTTCDDGDPNTTNDVIEGDGCTCSGTVPSTCEITVSTGPGSILIDGLTGANVIVHIFDDSWSTVFTCVNTCTNPQLVDQLANGTYYVKATNYNDSWVEECDIAEYHTVSGGSGLQSNNQPEYLFFNASKDGREVSLNWTTNTEYKNTYFVVERSTDGINFETINDVESRSDSHQAIHYQDKDTEPFTGANFYRLKEVFNTGEYRYSAVDVVVFDIDVDVFLLFPNPTADQVFINLKKFAGAAANIQIVNNLGQLMYTLDMNELPESPIGFDVSTYPSGMYGMSVKVEGHQQMTNLFIVTKL